MLSPELREEWMNRHKEGVVVKRIADEINNAIRRNLIRLGSSLTLNELAKITGSNKGTLKKYIAEIQAILYAHGIRLLPAAGLYVDPEGDEPNIPVIMNCALKTSMEKCVEDFTTELNKGAKPGPLPFSLIRSDHGRLVITPLPGFPKIELPLP